MPSEAWIVIPNWRRFQHYSDRDPRWIKNYVAQLHDDDYLDLTFHLRGVLHGIRLLYASSACQLPADTKKLSHRLGQRVTRANLASLYDAGLIELAASKPLAKCSTPLEQSASPKQSREEENKSRAEVRGGEPVDNDRGHAILKLIAEVRGSDDDKARLRAFLERSELAPFAYHAARQELVVHRSSVRNDCGYVRRIIERYLTEAA